jgi:hypothetical protein
MLIFEKLNVGGNIVRSTITPNIRNTVGSNVRGELVFSVMVAGWFCEKSG